MNSILASMVCFVFVILALWHVYWAIGGSRFKHAAIPTRDGKRAFEPSALGTAAVGGALFLCAALVAATSGLIHVPLPARLLSWLCYALALALTARAIGDFRLVGFFKRVRDGVFARLDTAVYSPLCLALAIAVLLVGMNGVDLGAVL